MYYRVIVISEEAKGHVSDKERKLVLNYKSSVELNTFSLQMLLKDFTPYNIIVVKVNKPHNRKRHYYETTDNLSTLCKKIREFLVTGNVEVEKVVYHDYVLSTFMPPIDTPTINKWFVSDIGYTFFQISTLNKVYYKGKLDLEYICKVLNEDHNMFFVSMNKEWIFIKESCTNVEIKNDMLILTRNFADTIKEKQHKIFEY